MHERTLMDICAIIRRDAYPARSSPNERQQTLGRCEHLIQEIHRLVAQNNQIKEFVAIAYTLGSGEHFQVDGSKCTDAYKQVLEMLSLSDLVSKETITIYSSKPKDLTAEAIA